MNAVFVALGSCIITLLTVSAFFFFKKNKVGFYCIDRKEQEAFVNQFKEIEEESKRAMDLRGNPTHECVCGSNIWNIRATFENYEIAQYFLEMDCIKCGSLATAPTPLDREKME